MCRCYLLGLTPLPVPYAHPPFAAPFAAACAPPAASPCPTPCVRPPPAPGCPGPKHQEGRGWWWRVSMVCWAAACMPCMVGEPLCGMLWAHISQSKWCHAAACFGPLLCDRIPPNTSKTERKPVVTRAHCPPIILSITHLALHGRPCHGSTQRLLALRQLVLHGRRSCLHLHGAGHEGMREQAERWKSRGSWPGSGDSIFCTARLNALMLQSIQAEALTSGLLCRYSKCTQLPGPLGT